MYFISFHPTVLMISHIENVDELAARQPTEKMEVGITDDHFSHCRWRVYFVLQEILRVFQ